MCSHSRLLNNNRFTGVIPDSFGNLTQLTDLDLNSCQLSGSIPATLGNLAKLKMLYMQFSYVEVCIAISSADRFLIVLESWIASIICIPQITKHFVKQYSYWKYSLVVRKFNQMRRIVLTRNSGMSTKISWTVLSPKALEISILR